jgi:hypothetical protein
VYTKQVCSIGLKDTPHILRIVIISAYLHVKELKNSNYENVLL